MIFFFFDEDGWWNWLCVCIIRQFLLKKCCEVIQFVFLFYGYLPSCQFWNNNLVFFVPFIHFISCYDFSLAKVFLLELITCAIPLILFCFLMRTNKVPVLLQYLSYVVCIL